MMPYANTSTLTNPIYALIIIFLNFLHFQSVLFLFWIFLSLTVCYFGSYTTGETIALYKYKMYMETTYRTFDPEPYQKFQESYFKSEKTKYRTAINKLEVDNCTYYVTYAGKKDTILSDDCQLIAFCDQKQNYYFGYADQSDGFPYVPYKTPILREKIPFDHLKEIDSKSGKLIIGIMRDKQPWKFKFQNKLLAKQWVKLLYDLKGKYQKRNRQSSQEKMASKIGNIFGVEVKPEMLQEQAQQMTKEITEWKHSYETLSKKSQDMNALLSVKDNKIAALEEELTQEKKNYLELVLKTDSQKHNEKKDDSRISSLKKQLETERRRCKDLKDALEQRDKTIADLQHQLKLSKNIPSDNKANEKSSDMTSQLKKTLEESYASNSKLKVEIYELKQKLVKNGIDPKGHKEILKTAQKENNTHAN